MTRSDRDRPLYMISVAAELSGMHPQTLRIYENKGLVNPKRSAGNTRLYSQADIEQLELIAQLTNEGINLAGVLRITDQQERLDKKEEEIESLRKRITRLEARLHELNMRQQITALARPESQMIQLYQDNQSRAAQKSPAQTSCYTATRSRPLCTPDLQTSVDEPLRSESLGQDAKIGAAQKSFNNQEDNEAQRS